MMIAATLSWLLGSTKSNSFEDQGFASSSSVAMASRSVVVFLNDDALSAEAAEVAASASAGDFRSVWRRCDNQKPKEVAPKRAPRITVRSGLSWRRARAGASLTPGMRGMSGEIRRGGEGGDFCKAGGVMMIAAAVRTRGDWPGKATTRANGRDPQ